MIKEKEPKRNFLSKKEIIVQEDKEEKEDSMSRLREGKPLEVVISHSEKDLLRKQNELLTRFLINAKYLDDDHEDVYKFNSFFIALKQEVELKVKESAVPTIVFKNYIGIVQNFLANFKSRPIKTKVTLPYKYFLACFYKSRTSYFRHLYKNIWSAEIRKQFRSNYPEIYETFKNDLAKLYLIKSPVSRHEEYLELEEIKSDYINFWGDEEHNLRGLFRSENPDVYELLLKHLPENMKDPEPYSGHVVLNKEVMNIDDLVKSKQIGGNKNE